MPSRRLDDLGTGDAHARPGGDVAGVHGEGQAQPRGAGAFDPRSPAPRGLRPAAQWAPEHAALILAGGEITATASCGHEISVLRRYEAHTGNHPCEACQAAQAARDARLARESRATLTGIPERYWHSSFTDLLERGFPGDAVLAAQAWASHGGGLLLFGPVGTGKTTVAAAAAWTRALQRPVRWLPARLLGLMATAEYGSAEHQAGRALAQGRRALVLDDLGREGPGAAALLANVIEARIDAQAPLLVTSNLSLDELAGRDLEGQRLASRLAGYCAQYVMDGPDHRLDHEP